MSLQTKLLGMLGTVPEGRPGWHQNKEKGRPKASVQEPQGHGRQGRGSSLRPWETALGSKQRKLEAILSQGRGVKGDCNKLLSVVTVQRCLLTTGAGLLPNAIKNKLSHTRSGRRTALKSKKPPAERNSPGPRPCPLLPGCWTIELAQDWTSDPTSWPW